MQHKMEKWTNYSIIGALTFILAISLGFNQIPDSNYYCDSRQIKSYCFELSSGTGTRCYTMPAKTKYMTCTEGWQKIPKIEEVPVCINPSKCTPVIAYTDRGKYFCDCIEKGQNAECKRSDALLPIGE